MNRIYITESYKKNIKKGFTLLEMLIVLGIIAVIITIASVSYSTAQKKSRDSRRKSDLKVVQNAMEQYYSVCGFSYPVVVDGLVPTVGCSSPVTVLLPNSPLDPKTGSAYLMPTSTASIYQICATLEMETPANFCLQNQQ
ncbi:MAG: prepilin-type N-terminal cleavage/methylation domain-containing protein [Patescibacteria group bacterium]